MKNVREYIILIVIIIALAAVYGWQQSNARKNADNLPQTAVFKAEDLTRIDITTPETAFELARNADGRWVIMPEGYPVEARLSSIMEEGLANFKLTNVVSESGQDYARYELDDARKVHVNAYVGDNHVLNVDLGAAVAGNFRHNYVKIAGDPNVYHGRGSLRTFFDTNAFELREKQILKFDPAVIDEIVLTMGGVERGLHSMQTKDMDGNDITIWLGPDNTYVDSGMVEGFLGFVGSTNVYEFLPMEQDAFGPTVYILTLYTTDDAKAHVLRVYEPDPDAEFEDEYSVVFDAASSDVLSPFQLTYAQQSDILKRFDDMLKVVDTVTEEPSGQLRVENLPED